MFIQHYYKIEENESFDPVNCPDVRQEIVELRERLADMPEMNKEDIVISYLKDYSLETRWTGNNPKLVSAIISGGLPTARIEAYFNSCKGNIAFTRDFGDFIRARFRE